jgi:hypothetical protein
LKRLSTDKHRIAIRAMYSVSILISAYARIERIAKEQS